MESKGRIIFVGIHNKPEMEPLDSRTKSGKIIDEVIAGLKGFAEPWRYFKTNLFDLQQVPETYTGRHEYAHHWKVRQEPTKHDIVVCLGETVKINVPHLTSRVIHAAHPANRHHKREEYIANLIKLIKDANI